MLIAAVSYGAIGLIEDPLGREDVLRLGVHGRRCDERGILASQALVGQVAESQSRGAIIGVFSTSPGAAGYFARLVHRRNSVRRVAPIGTLIVVAAGDALLAIFAFYVFWSSRRRND
jgi:hypothetical protein